MTIDSERLERAPLFPETRGAAIAAIIIGVVALTFSSRLDVPMVPVPMTLQTLAVLLAGGLLGLRFGTATVLVWLALGAAGLPLFADGAGGIVHFAGPTGGYLVGFVPAAALMGFAADRGWMGNLPRALGVAVVAHSLCLVFGGTWLAMHIGVEPALAGGVVPFLPGAAVKSVAVTLIAWSFAWQQR